MKVSREPGMTRFASVSCPNKGALLAVVMLLEVVDLLHQFLTLWKEPGPNGSLRNLTEPTFHLLLTSPAFISRSGLGAC